MLEAYFALSGRIRRLRFFAHTILLWIVILLLSLLAIPLVNHARYPATASIMAIGLIGLFWIWAGMALVVKRLHDLDWSGWHYLWMFLLPAILGSGLSIHASGSFERTWTVGFGYSPGIVSFLAILYLIFARGTDGRNRFGYPP